MLIITKRQIKRTAEGGLIPPTGKGITMKILYFEAAGCVPRGDVENCRIRTAFVNDEGKQIYLELSGIEVTKTMHESFKVFTNAGFVDHCFKITEDKPNDDENKHRLPCERNEHFEYSKDGILEFVNDVLNCSFAEVIICDSFYGYHVHKDGGGYNFIEQYDFDDERADKARAAFERLDMSLRKQLNSKYSKISLVGITENSVIAKCYASDEEMSKAGLNPRQRFFTLLI